MTEPLAPAMWDPRGNALNEPARRSDAIDIGLGLLWAAASAAGTGASAYHGYKRNESVGWGIWWAICGAVLPVVTVPIALAQGFGKRKNASLNAVYVLDGVDCGGCGDPIEKHSPETLEECRRYVDEANAEVARDALADLPEYIFPQTMKSTRHLR